jgi:hypothetical protein
MPETVDFTSVYMPLLNPEMLSSIFGFEQKNLICQLRKVPVFHIFSKNTRFLAVYEGFSEKWLSSK